MPILLWSTLHVERRQSEQSVAKFKTETRVVRNAGPRRTLSLPAIPTAVGRLPTESGVEYAGLIEMSFDKDFSSLKVQPRTFELTVLGKAASYTPDVEYVRRNGIVGYREFKFDIEALDDETKNLLAAASAELSAQGFEYSVRDLTMIRGGHRLDNIRLLRRYSRVDCSDRFAMEVVRHVQSRPGLPFAELREWVGSSNFPGLMRAFWDQRLRFEMADAMLGPSTCIWPGEPS